MPPVSGVVPMMSQNMNVSGVTSYSSDHSKQSVQRMHFQLQDEHERQQLGRPITASVALAAPIATKTTASFNPHKALAKFHATTTLIRPKAQKAPRPSQPKSVNSGGHSQEHKTNYNGPSSSSRPSHSIPIGPPYNGVQQQQQPTHIRSKSNHPLSSPNSSLPMQQQEQLLQPHRFERLVTNEVQQMKAYARIIESLNRKLDGMESIHVDLEHRLTQETTKRRQMEDNLEQRERFWTDKMKRIHCDRDRLETISIKLLDRLDRKEQELQALYQEHGITNERSSSPDIMMEHEFIRSSQKKSSVEDMRSLLFKSSPVSRKHEVSSERNDAAPDESIYQQQPFSPFEIVTSFARNNNNATTSSEAINGMEEEDEGTTRKLRLVQSLVILRGLFVQVCSLVILCNVALYCDCLAKDLWLEITFNWLSIV